jgi:hypothetical protein
VSVNSIAILVGEVTLIPSGRKVGAGMVARATPGGGVFVGPFDMSHAGEGRLMSFNGPMPGFEDRQIGGGPALTLDLSQLDIIRTMEIGTNLPSSNLHFFPPDIDRNKRDAKAPSRPDREMPGTGGGGGGYN